MAAFVRSELATVTQSGARALAALPRRARVAMSAPSLHGHLVRASKAKAPGKAPSSDAAPPPTKDGVYVQENLHAKVAFNRGRQASPALLACAAKIRAACAVPPDFVLDKVRFGPLGGILEEERLLAAYRAGLLERRGGAALQPLCSECAAETHWRDNCSTLL